MKILSCSVSYIQTCFWTRDHMILELLLLLHTTLKTSLGAGIIPQWNYYFKCTFNANISLNNWLLAVLFSLLQCASLSRWANILKTHPSSPQGEASKGKTSRMGICLANSSVWDAVDKNNEKLPFEITVDGFLELARRWIQHRYIILYLKLHSFCTNRPVLFTLKPA